MWGMIVKGIWYPEIAEITQGSFVTTCLFSTKNCIIDLLWASGRLLEKKSLNCSKTTLLLERLSNIPVFAWLAIATGNFEVERSSDLVEQPGTFPRSGPSP